MAQHGVLASRCNTLSHAGVSVLVPLYSNQFSVNTQPSVSENSGLGLLIVCISRSKLGKGRGGDKLIKVLEKYLKHNDFYK